MEIIYLAAGRGSRLKKETKQLPKCLVEINGKSILEHNLNFLQNFKRINIVTGYKSVLIKKKLAKYKIIKKNINFIYNREFKKTNMVYSAFLAKPKEKVIVICYGDIIFSSKIYNLILRSKIKNYIFVKKNWFNLWKKRMSYKKILADAEDIKIKQEELKSIGGHITKLPSYQYMGILKMKSAVFKKLKKFFLKNNNIIDFTTFINSAIKLKIVKFKVIKTNCYWFEIDTPKDITVTEKYLS